MKKQTTDGLHNAFHEQEEHYEDQKKKRARSKKEEKNVTRFIRTKTAFFTTFTYISIVCWVFVGYVMYNYVTLEDAENDPVTVEKAQVIQVEVMESESVTEAKNEGIPEGYEVYKTMTATATAYNTVPEQTDDTPCISASNKNICGRNDIVAMNGFKFGTKVLMDGKVYTVEDRKASRFDSSWIDISFDKDMQGAIDFGKRPKEIIVLKKINT